MQPLRLSIPGRFWDSQIYAGRLYLFTEAGSVCTIDWDRLVSEWQVALRLALECAFRRSDYLYALDFSLLLQDEDIKTIILGKFEELGHETLMIEELGGLHLIGEQDVPFPFPHSDCLIYQSQMYAGTSNGLYRATCDKRTVKPLSTRGERKWDGPAISIAASYNEVAVAAGDFGLFEIPIRPTFGRSPRATIETPCNKCSWNFQSIYCTGPGAHNGWLADFEKVKIEGDAFKSRRFAKALNSEDIFGESGFTWSRQDKIYLAGRDGLKFARYIPWEKPDRRLVRSKDPIKLRTTAEVLAGGVANFGTVLEFEDSLSVLLSNGEEFVISGDPVSWRIFPGSKHYTNQLHVVFEDRLELYSFNQDYFLDQERKTIGTTNFRFGGRSSRLHWESISEVSVEDVLDDDPDADDIDWRDVLDES